MADRPAGQGDGPAGGDAPGRPRRSGAVPGGASGPAASIPAVDRARLRGPRLTSLSPAAGCAAKLGMAELDDLLDRAFGGPGPGPPGAVAGPPLRGVAGPPPSVERADLVGIGDDAAVVAARTGRVVATTDFFPPIVDDPTTWGHVAATNAIADVHAMGGVPHSALVVLGWPAGARSADLDDVLAGLRAGAAADGVALVGGHTIESSVPFVGLAVLGDLDGPPLRQDRARPGDLLVLSAPLGTGIVTTAARRAEPADADPGGSLHEVLAAAVAVMTTSNAAVGRLARAHGVVAATDVTGFGLLGHLHRLARASAVDVEVEAAAVPLLPGVVDLARRGIVPGGSRRNAHAVVAGAGVRTDPVTLAVLADAQTSGGMLLSCPPARAGGLVAALRAASHRAATIGSVERAGTGAITGAITVVGTLDGGRAGVAPGGLGPAGPA